MIKKILSLFVQPGKRAVQALPVRDVDGRFVSVERAKVRAKARLICEQNGIEVPQALKETGK